MLAGLDALQFGGHTLVKVHKERVDLTAGTRLPGYPDGIVESACPIARFPDQRRGRHLVARHVLLVSGFPHHLDQAGNTQHFEELADDRLGIGHRQSIRVGCEGANPSKVETEPTAPGDVDVTPMTAPVS